MGYSYRDKTALITGASSGIGEAYARALARRGMNLILVARSRGKLETLARKLAREHKVSAEVITADVGQPGIGEHLAAAVAKRGLAVDLLLNNAGFGTYGRFEEQDPAREQEEIAVNVAAVVDLTHAFLPPMLAKGEGGIINVASVAAFQPTPYMTVYGATKAFVLSFTEGLWAEYRGCGIRTLALCPGPVATGFFTATGNKKLEKRMGRVKMMKAEDVVEQSLKAFERGKSCVVPGAGNVVMAFSSRLAPRRLVAGLAAQVLRPGRRRSATGR